MMTSKELVRELLILQAAHHELVFMIEPMRTKIDRIQMRAESALKILDFLVEVDEAYIDQELEEAVGASTNAQFDILLRIGWEYVNNLNKSSKGKK